jgi:hypothetical protein
VLIVDDPLIKGIELFSLFLEDFITYGLMLADTIGIELSSASNTALSERRWIVLHNVSFVRLIYFLNRFILKSILSDCIFIVANLLIVSLLI